MTDTDPGASARAGAAAPHDDSRRGRSRWLRAALALGLVVGLVVAVDGVRSAEDGVGSTDAATIATVPVAAVATAPTAAAAPAGSAPTGPSAPTPPVPPAPTPPVPPATAGAAPTDVPVIPDAPVGVEVMPLVGVGDDVALGALETTVVSVGAVRVSPHGPGEIAGPAAAVDLRVRNTSQAPVDLTGLVVTASSQDGGTPAVPASGDPASPLTGALAPGEERSGTYVFTTGPAPGDGATPSLRVEVGLDTARGVASVLAG